MNYQALYDRIRGTSLHPWLELMPQQIDWGLSAKRHGDIPRWLELIRQLPAVEPGDIDFNRDFVTTGIDRPLQGEQRNQARELLYKLSPWRKGPYRLHGIEIDTEWRSDWKWQRVEKYLLPLRGRRILDVGCGNGYHCWRMLGAGAQLVIGVDPSPLFVMQYAAVKHFTGEHPFYLLPVGVESVPEKLAAFDTVFSMGVLYHRRSPIDHLMHLKDCLRPGGQLVLETLVIDGDSQQVLVPADRYAKMRNVWFIPSAAGVQHWLQRCGFEQVEVVDINVTSTDEQRATDWMRNESLIDFLDAKDTRRTVEGYQAPTRAIITALAP